MVVGRIDPNDANHFYLAGQETLIKMQERTFK